VTFNSVQYANPVSTGYCWWDQELFLVPGEKPSEMALVAPSGPKDPERLFGFGTRADMFQLAKHVQRPADHAERAAEDDRLELWEEWRRGLPRDSRKRHGARP
jgi:hypothetical protein